jgi:hypothetical protein
MPSGCAEHSSLYRLPAASFSPWQARHRSVYFQSGRKLLNRTAGFRRLMLQYAGVRLTEETQHLACMALHAVSPASLGGS